MSEGDAIWNQGYEVGKRAKIRRLQAENKRLKEALESVCSRCRHLETVQKALKGDHKSSE